MLKPRLAPLRAAPLPIMYVLALFMAIFAATLIAGMALAAPQPVPTGNPVMQHAITAPAPADQAAIVLVATADGDVLPAYIHDRALPSAECTALVGAKQREIAKRRMGGALAAYRVHGQCLTLGSGAPAAKTT